MMEQPVNNTQPLYESAAPPTRKTPRWLVILVGGAGLAIIISAVLRLITPPVVPVPTSTLFQTNYDGTQTRFSGVVFTGEVPTLPSQLTVAKTTPTQLSVETVKNQIINGFQLKPVEGLDSAWNSDTFLFVFNADTNSYVLSHVPTTTKIGFNDSNQAVNAAQSLLTQYFPDMKLSPLANRVRYFSGGEEPSGVTANEAQIVSIPFAYQADGFPVYYQNQSQVPFEVQLDPDLQLVKLFFHPQFIQLESIGKQNVLPLAAAIAQIQNGQAALIATNQIQPGEINIKSLTSVDLQTVSVEYRVDSEHNLAYPFYRFNGVAKSSTNQDLTIEVITPAVVTSR